MNFKPMLSATLTEELFPKLRFPLLVSPKLDGVRCIVWEGVAYSRNAKPIRNHFVQKWAKGHHGLDGELIVGSPTSPLCLNTTQSGVMAFEGEPDFRFHLFDAVEGDDAFELRMRQVQDEMGAEVGIVCVLHEWTSTLEELQWREEKYVQDGYEGMMLRSPNGPYKHGRSTMREQYLMKLKRFVDGEAVVTGLEEGTRNDNVLQRDELGRAKRSTHAENLVGNGMVGTILAHDKKWGPLRIAPGIMPHHERAGWWQKHMRVLQNKEQWDTLLGKTIHWRSFGYGVKDKPRFPRFYGVRLDL